MDAETKRRLETELAVARVEKKRCAESAFTSRPGDWEFSLGRLYALDAEIESLLHRLAQEG